MNRPLILSLLIVIGLFARSHEASAGETRDIVVAGGCFWCVESDFESVPGVKEVISGYTGGRGQNPTYKQVSRGGTGHYEAARIIYDSGVVTRDQLYDLFFRSVDPTDAGGQFCDRGDSYRTAIFADGAAERKAAEMAKTRAQAALGRTIVTPVLTAGAFWPAEDYHQNYYKGTSRVITRFGVIRQNAAYARYREGCGRDQRVKQLWGSAAAFAH